NDALLHFDPGQFPAGIQLNDERIFRQSAAGGESQGTVKTTFFGARDHPQLIGPGPLALQLDQSVEDRGHTDKIVAGASVDPPVLNREILQIPNGESGPDVTRLARSNFKGLVETLASAQLRRNSRRHQAHRDAGAKIGIRYPTAKPREPAERRERTQNFKTRMIEVGGQRNRALASSIVKAHEQISKPVPLARQP